MKVRELQEQLSKLDPEIEIICYCEEKKFLDKSRGFVLLDVLAVNNTEAERFRLDDGTPYLKFGKGPGASSIATLEITTNF